jgi:hypothetical protein
VRDKRRLHDLFLLDSGIKGPQQHAERLLGAGSEQAVSYGCISFLSAL